MSGVLEVAALLQASPFAMDLFFSCAPLFRSEMARSMDALILSGVYIRGVDSCLEDSFEAGIRFRSCFLVKK